VLGVLQSGEPEKLRGGERKPFCSIWLFDLVEQEITKLHKGFNRPRSIGSSVHFLDMASFRVKCGAGRSCREQSGIRAYTSLEDIRDLTCSRTRVKNVATISDRFTLRRGTT
jgi:hypothetical protein